MPKSPSIAATLADKISPGVNSIRSAFKSLSKDSDEVRNKISALQTKQGELIKVQAQLKTNLVEANKAVKEATKAFTDSGDAISKVNLDKAHEKYLSLTEQLKGFREEAKRTNSEIRGLQTEQSKLSNTADGGIGGALMKAGFGRMFGESLGQASMAYFTSAYGTPAGDALSSIVSGAITGAAMGSIIPGIGTVGGAALGTVSGAINASTQVYSAENDAFKAYRDQQLDEQTGRIQSDISSGSGIAAQRELDQIAFSKLMGGEGIASNYLSWVKDTANSTPLLYDDLKAMSKTLATYGYSPEEMQKRLIQIGDTGSALGMNTSDMSMVATGLGRMKSSGKTSLEYLNILTERGIPAIDYLAKAMGATNAEVYDMVSKGLIPGAKAAEIIADKMGEANSGAMTEMAETYSGLTSTVAGLNQEMQNAYGEGYNAERSKGLGNQIDYLSSVQASDTNKKIGAYYASLENEKERIIREHEKAAYARIEAENITDEAEMGRLLAEARVAGIAEYNKSDGAQLEAESQRSLINSVGAILAGDKTYWNSGYLEGQERSKGMAAAINAYIDSERKRIGYAPAASTVYAPNYEYGGSEGVSDSGTFSDAFGLSYVPYDNFPARLHEGEQVLTASEARKRNSAAGITIPKLADTLVVREEADIYRIAQEIAREIINAQMLS